MRKIPTVFARNHDGDRRIRDEVVPGCEWVLDGEGEPYPKWDGTAVLVRRRAGGVCLAFKRYDAKPGRTPPPLFEPCMEPDPVTGHCTGWVPAFQTDPANKYLWEAMLAHPPLFLNSGSTYELCGPKIPPSRKTRQNPHMFESHVLIPHDAVKLGWFPRSFDGMRQAFSDDILTRVEWDGMRETEGVVFHHPDGRMAKVKRSDFGLAWPPQ